MFGITEWSPSDWGVLIGAIAAGIVYVLHAWRLPGAVKDGITPVVREAIAPVVRDAIAPVIRDAIANGHGLKPPAP